MADRGKTKIVDSYTTLKAAQRRAQETRAPEKASPSESSASERPAEPVLKRPGTHFGRTVMPTRHEIVCYSCGFEFKITGKANQTYCPKCRSQLDLTDRNITGICAEEILTAGKVTLTSSAVLDGGRISANMVVLQGTVKDGHLQAYHTLELAGGAVIPEHLIHARNLRIAADASFAFRKKATFHHVDVYGELKANLWAEGLVTVHPGGHLKGKLHTAHFTVHDGGGLTADIHVEPKKKEPEPPPKGKAEEAGEAEGTG